MSQLAAQFNRVQAASHRTDPNYTSARWQRVYNASVRYAGNIRRSRAYRRGGDNAQVSRRVYMGLSNG